MNTLSTYLSYMLPLLVLLACSRESGNPEHDIPQDNTLIIANAWVRPAAEGTNSAAYMTIHNHTSRTDTLISISSEAAAMAEVHESYEEEGMAGMRSAGELVIQPGNHLELKPGSFHIMLMQVRRQLVSEDSLRLSLQFAGAGTKEVTAVVK